MTNGKQITLYIFVSSVIFGAGTLVGSTVLRGEGIEDRLAILEQQAKESDIAKSVLLTNVAVITVELTNLSKKVDQIQGRLEEINTRLIRIK